MHTSPIVRRSRWVLPVCLVVLSRLCSVRFRLFALGRAIACGRGRVAPFTPIALGGAARGRVARLCSCVFVPLQVFVVIVAAKAWLVNNNNNERKEINRKTKRKRTEGAHLTTPCTCSCRSCLPLLGSCSLVFVCAPGGGLVHARTVAAHSHSW